MDSGSLSPQSDGVPAIILSSIAYGSVSTLFTMSFLSLCRQLRLKRHWSHITFLIIIAAVFTLSTVFMVAAILLFRMTVAPIPSNGDLIDNMDVLFDIGNVSYVFGNWLMDGLLVWRCIRISNTFDGRVVKWIMLCKIVLLCMASIAFGSIFIAGTWTSIPGTWTFVAGTWTFTAGASAWNVAFICVSFTLNIIATGFAVFRLFLFRHRLVQVLGKGHGSLYSRVGIILAESAALYSLFVIMYIVAYVSDSALSGVFLQMLPQIQAISSLLIVMRIMSGRELTRAGADSERDAGTIVFRPCLGEGSAHSMANVPPSAHSLGGFVLAHDVFTSKD